jgi:small conductance mechanosensitive channel
LSSGVIGVVDGLVRCTRGATFEIVRAPARLALAPTLTLTLGLIAASASAAPPAEPPVAAGPIELEFSPARDAAIAARLQQIYARLDNLVEIEVEVEAGVVTLRGQALGFEDVNEAIAVARRVDGVVAVQSDVEQIYSLERRLRPLIVRLRARSTEFLLFLPLLLAGVTIVAGAWLLARLLARAIRRRSRIAANAFLRELIARLGQALVIVIALVLALELMGASTLIGALLGTAGLVGLALSFAFRDTAENYIASILLSVRKPFEPNDLIEVEGQLGHVIRLTMRATVMLTIDGNHVRIPNATVFKSVLINYTRNPQRRFHFELGVAVEAVLREVQELACATLSATPGVLDDPPPMCLVEGFGDSAMTVSIAGWVDQRQASWLKVSSEARRRIKVAFEDAGIDVPEPIFRVRTAAFERDAELRPVHGETGGAADVSPDDTITRQVERERAVVEDDLLRTDSPIE